MPNSNDIPWGRLVAEGLAIVVSILLAFGIDAWWDERQERIEEQQILHDLKKEFSLIRDVLASRKQGHMEREQGLEALLTAIDDRDRAMTEEILTAALDSLFAPSTSDISNGTLHALLGSGRLEIITNRALREKLVGWESAIAEVWDDEQDNVKLVWEIVVPYFIDEGHGAGELLGYWYPESAVPVRSISEDPERVKRLLNDPRFRSLVEIRYLFKLHTTGEFENAIAAVDAILADINASIAR